MEKRFDIDRCAVVVVVVLAFVNNVDTGAVGGVWWYTVDEAAVTKTLVGWIL